MDLNVKTSKIINFLSQLEKKKIISQSSLAKNVLISLGMTNAILKKAISKGFVKAKAAPYKRYIYYLTKEGFTEKSRLVREYLDSSLNFFKKAKLAYQKILVEIKKKKYEIVLVGDGDLVDICKLSLLQENLKVSGHMKFTKQKTLRYEFNNTKKSLTNLAFVIVESKKPQLIYDSLFSNFDHINVYYPKFLHISKKPN
tara:strand:+ start:192 stop:788 length:597 start_codon:yes stop_codon:yes gene_type:complete